MNISFWTIQLAINHLVSEGDMVVLTIPLIYPQSFLLDFIEETTHTPFACIGLSRLKKSNQQALFVSEYTNQTLYLSEHLFSWCLHQHHNVAVGDMQYKIIQIMPIRTCITQPDITSTFARLPQSIITKDMYTALRIDLESNR